MRISAREVLFSGQDRCPEFDCPQTLPEELSILLCRFDGAERRLQLQAKIYAGARDLGADRRNPSVEKLRLPFSIPGAGEHEVMSYGPRHRPR